MGQTTIVGTSVHRVGWVYFLGATAARFNKSYSKASSNSQWCPCPQPLASKSGPTWPLRLRCGTQKIWASVSLPEKYR